MTFQYVRFFVTYSGGGITIEPSKACNKLLEIRTSFSPLTQVLRCQFHDVLVGFLCIRHWELKPLANASRPPGVPQRAKLLSSILPL